MKKVKEKHLKINSNITENEFVLMQVKESFTNSFKNIARKNGIRLSDFVNKLEETFKVNDYKNKNEDEFLEVLIKKVVKPVFEENGIKLVD